MSGGMPLSITSQSASNPNSGIGEFGLGFTASPVYNKPFIDLSNPVHLGLVVFAVLLAYRAYRKK